MTRIILPYQHCTTNLFSRVYIHVSQLICVCACIWVNTVYILDVLYIIIHVDIKPLHLFSGNVHVYCLCTLEAYLHVDVQV